MRDQFSWVRGLYQEVVAEGGWDRLSVDQKIEKLDARLRELRDGYPEDYFPTPELWAHISGVLDEERANEAPGE